VKQIPFGSTVVVRGIFRHAATKTLVDPPVVRIMLQPRVAGEDEEPEVFVYGTDPELIRESAGTYKVVWVPPTPGGWRYHWEGDGPVRARGDGSFLLTKPFI
jgi:hypothetical protein